MSYPIALFCCLLGRGACVQAFTGARGCFQSCSGGVGSVVEVRLQPRARALGDVLC